MKAMIHVGAFTPQEGKERNQCDGCAAGAELNQYGNHVYLDGSLIACTKERYGINTTPTDSTYEARCLKFDAERAWKMREPLEKALSWPKGTAQHGIWMAAYNAAKGEA